MTVEAEDLPQLSRVRALSRSGAAKSIRLAAGLSLGEVARAIDVTPATVLRWERGERVPTGKRALHYLTVLESLMRR
jgi:DNA-binding transcriptional regulator YiaG